jgi:hypothetical protein
MVHVIIFFRDLFFLFFFGGTRPSHSVEPISFSSVQVRASPDIAGKHHIHFTLSFILGPLCDCVVSVPSVILWKKITNILREK